MKITTLLLLVCILIGCDHRDQQDTINDLNGYWQIKKAVMPDGSVKQFAPGQIIDYIKISERKGIRKKLRLEFDGEFRSSHEQESFVVRPENDTLRIFYTTRFDTRKETLISVDKEQLITRGETGIRFVYQKYHPNTD